jgi:hypothetical protein
MRRNNENHLYFFVWVILQELLELKFERHEILGFNPVIFRPSNLKHFPSGRTEGIDCREIFVEGNVIFFRLDFGDTIKAILREYRDLVFRRFNTTKEIAFCGC